MNVFVRRSKPRSVKCRLLANRGWCGYAYRYRRFARSRFESIVPLVFSSYQLTRTILILSLLSISLLSSACEKGNVVERGEPTVSGASRKEGPERWNVDLECGDCGKFSIGRSTREFERIKEIVKATTVTKYPYIRAGFELECGKLLDALREDQFQPLKEVGVVNIDHPVIQKNLNCSLGGNLTWEDFVGPIGMGDPNYGYELYNLGFDLVHGVDEHHISTYPHTSSYTGFDFDQCGIARIVEVFRVGSSLESDARPLLLSAVVERMGRFYLWSVQEDRDPNQSREENPNISLKLVDIRSPDEFVQICGWSPRTSFIDES